MDEWAQMRLGDLGTVITGRTPPAAHPDYFGDEVPFITPSDFGDTRRVSHPARRLSESGARALQRALVRKAVAVSCIGWQMGKVRLIDEPSVTNQQINTVLVDEAKVDRHFLYYALVQKQAELFRLASGGSRTPILNKSEFERILLKIPSLAEQGAIAAVLNILDDKIELNGRMSITLEATARAIFKSWFVDFDPVQTKSEGRQPFGMDAETAADFTTSFEDSPFGRIPKGWTVAGLDQLADFLNGLALQKYPPGVDGFLPAIKIAQLRRGNSDGADRASKNIPPEFVVHDGDVLFSWSGTLDVVIWCGGPGALNQHLFKVSSSRYPKWFFYHWILEHLPSFQHIAAGKATTMGHIQRHHLADAKALIPTEPLMLKADRIMNPLLQKGICNDLESRTLTALRDALLPKLISGEIRVKDVERMVAETV